MPSTLKKIAYSAFDQCGYLEHIKFPDGLECIDALCFRETGLKEVVFPPGLRQVGECAF